MIKKLIIIPIFFLLVALIPDAIAQTNTQQLNQTETLINNLITEVKSYQNSRDTKSEQKQKIDNVLNEYFDIGNMTKFVAGPYWKTMSPLQQEEYKRLFRENTCNQIYALFSDKLINTNFDHQIVETKFRGNYYIIVTSAIKIPNRESINVSWRMPVETLRIVDIEFGNISFLRTGLTEIRKRLRPVNVDSYLNDLRELQSNELYAGCTSYN